MTISGKITLLSVQYNNKNNKNRRDFFKVLKNNIFDIEKEHQGVKG